MLAEQTQPSGEVVGIDIDDELLAWAASSRPDYLPRSACSFKRGDIRQIDEPRDTFDLTFFSNGFAYADEPAALLREQIRVTKPGGTVACRHFDHTCLVLHPAEPGLVTRVAAAAAEAEDAASGRPTPFRNSFGQQLHGLLLSAGLQSVQTRTYAVQFQQPLSSDAKRYISVTALWYSYLAGNRLDSATREEWNSLFQLDSARCVLHQPEFFFVCLEMQSVGRKPSNNRDETPS